MKNWPPSYATANNVTSQNIPTINYSGNSVWGFDVYSAARLTATTNLFSNYHIRAVNRNGSWVFMRIDEMRIKEPVVCGL